MQTDLKVQLASDDEDDLENLRLAALQSLKRPVAPSIIVPPQYTHQLPVPQPHIAPPKAFGSRKRPNNKGFHNGRGVRNGTFGRVRNSNLISVPTISTEEASEDASLSLKNNKPKSAPKLILPQDRYCNSAGDVDADRLDQVCSKFDRYNNSSESDSESDNEKETSPKILAKSDSLEDLMQKLDREIMGELVEKSNEKETKSSITSGENEVAKEFDKSRKVDVKNCVGDEIASKPHKMERKRPLLEYDGSSMIAEKRVAVEMSVPNPPPLINPDHAVNFNGGLREPIPYGGGVPGPISLPQPPPPQIYHPPVPRYMNTVPFDSYTYPNSYPLQNEICAPGINPFPPEFHRSLAPLPPLEIKTDILDTVSAPLSPRSAAFVLQNREIIERRKKSPPRRSFSPNSPEHRRRYLKRSKSPSPIRNRTRRLSPPPKKLQSRTRRSSLHSNSSRSPNRLSPHINTKPTTLHSPTADKSAQSNKNVCQINDHINDEERHSDRISRQSSLSLSLSPAPDRDVDLDELEKNTNGEEDGGKHDGILNPTMEARRRKFEEKGPILTEGIIRLKPKNESSDEISEDGVKKLDENEPELKPEVEEEDDDDDTLLGDGSDLDEKLNLFSDEESEDDNEGRFKSNSDRKPRNVTVLPFTKLINGTSNATKAVENKKLDELKGHLSENRDRSDRKDRPSGGRSHRKSYRHTRYRKKRRISTTPEKTTKEKTAEETKVSSEKDSSRKKSHRGGGGGGGSSSTVEKRPPRRKSPIVLPIESKKIEIKIRNPSKYEESSTKKDRSSSKSRKVKVGEKDAEREDAESANLESHVSDVEVDASLNKGDGDLRAQLSRKRAERRVPKLEGVPSRILQTALQGVVYKKSETKSQESLDKKRPVHLRLGIPGSADAATCDSGVTNQKSGSKRSKYKGSSEQV